MVIQIYEIQDPLEAEKLVEMGVDHIGSVILDKKQWKSEKIKDVVNVCKDARKKSSMIFLFQDMGTIAKAIEYYMPDIVHFCEDITDGIQSHISKQVILKQMFPYIIIMRSLPVPLAGKESILKIEDIKELEPCTDIFLIDTYIDDSPVSGYIGITGRVCDWNIAREIVRVSSKPVILGGGINPANVYEAISLVKPYGIDSCTGTNVVDEHGNPIRFKKDMDKVKKIMEECKRYEREKNIN